MRRYVTRPTAYIDDYEHLTYVDYRQGLTVHEPDGEPRWTGLYDQYGNALYAVEEVGPIGFGRGDY